MAPSIMDSFLCDLLYIYYESKYMKIYWYVFMAADIMKLVNNYVCACVRVYMCTHT